MEDGKHRDEIIMGFGAVVEKLSISDLIDLKRALMMLDHSVVDELINGAIKRK